MLQDQGRTMEDNKKQAWTHLPARQNVTIGIIAGLAGGLAEVLWVILFATGGSADPSAVAVEVTRTLVVQVPPSQWAVWLGVVIHMALAGGLGVVFVAVLSQFPARISTPAFVVSAAIVFGAGIWGVNFLFFLPLLNPTFVAILPGSVTLTSKLLFALGLASGLQGQQRLGFHLAPCIQARR